MKCALSDALIKRIRTTLAGAMRQSITDKIPFNIKKHMDGVYAMYKIALDEESAIDAALIIPVMAQQLLATNEQAEKSMLALNPELLNEIASNKNIDLSRVDTTQGTLDIISELLAAQRKEEKAGEALKKTMSSSAMPINMSKKFTKVPPSKAIDTNSGDYNNPETKIYDTVKHKILDALNKLVANFDSTKVVYPGLIGGIHIKIVPHSAIPEGSLRPGTILSNDRLKNNPVMLITDESGKPILFDENGDISGIEGKLIYYVLQKPTSEHFDAAGEVVKLFPEDEEAIKALMRKSNLEYEGAKQQIIKELKLMNKLYQHFEKGGEELTGNINGGSHGNPISERNKRTALTQVNFGEEVFEPQTESVADETIGTKSGTTYFALDSLSGMLVEIERPKFTPEMADKVASILVDDLYETGKDGKPIAISNTKRKKIFETYFYHKTDPGKKIETIEYKDGIVFIKDLPLKTGTPEERTAAKEAITNFLTTLHIARRTTYGKASNFMKENMGKQKEGAAVPLNGVDIQKLRDDLSNATGTKDENNARKALLNAELGIYDEPKLNVNTTNFEDVNLVDKGGKLMVEPSGKTVKQYVLDNGFYITHETDTTGKLVRKNPYLSFGLNKASEDDLIKPTIKEKIKEVKDQPVDKNNLSKGGPQSNRAKFLEEARKRANDGKKRNKLFDQAAMSVQATEEQIAAAKIWYESHPLSKYFPFEVLFNAINTEDSSSVATWTLAGITLYKGSDFSDLYHEAWHAFVQTFLDDVQKEALYGEMRKMDGSFVNFLGTSVSFKNASELELEEYMAEDFRNYMLSGGKTRSQSPVRNSIFRKILDFLEWLFSDLSYQEVVDNNRVGSKISELYEKMRIGNLNGYTFAQENAHFDKLNTGAKRITKDNPVTVLSAQSSRELADSMDSILSQYIDFLNTNLDGDEMHELSEAQRRISEKDGTPQELSNLRDRIKILENKRTYSYTTKVIHDPVEKQNAYKYILAEFAFRLEQLQEGIKDVTDEDDKALMQKSIDTLTWGIKEFGDVDNISNNPRDAGLISYHHASSEFYSDEYKADYFEGLTDEEIADKYDSPGNGVSLIGMAEHDILYLLRGLHATGKDDNGNYTEALELNSLGFPKLIPFDHVWNRLARTLQNTRTIDGVEGTNIPGMIQKIEATPINDSLHFALKQLTRKLGPVNTEGMSETRLWSQFYQTFSKTNIALIQANVKTDTFTINKDTGEKVDVTSKRYTILIGESGGDHSNIRRRWNNDFKAYSSSEFIFKNKDNIATLDIKGVLKRFDKTSATKQNPIAFLHAIGIPISDNAQISSAIKEGYGLGYIYDNLKALDAADQLVQSVDDIVMTPTEMMDRVTADQANQVGRLNELAILEAQFSDQNMNFMRQNAEGNTQFEHSLNNTLTVIVNTINEANSYDEVIRLPYMEFMNVDKNPQMKSSIWLQSIFNKDDKTGRFTTKKKTGQGIDAEFVKMELKNLSGVAMFEDGNKVEGAGTASASADEFTKILMDFHMLVLKGMPELMRHADKGTSFSVFLNSLFPDPTKPKGQNLYVKTENFADNSSYNEGYKQTVKLLIPKISTELERINILREYEKKGITNYDFKYMKDGQTFQAFDDVLSNDTKTKILAIPIDTTLEDYLLNNPNGAALEATINKEIIAYFEDQVKKVGEIMPEVKGKKFMSSDVISKVRGAASNTVWEGQKLDDSKKNELAENAAITSFVVNSWIHNIESITFLYGDLALYNHQKEEFHKRNAGIASTGNIYRTDRAMKNFANNKLGRGYAKKLGLPQKIWDGTLDTAVLADMEVQSIYYDEYVEAIEQDIRKRLTGAVKRIKDETTKAKRAESLESDIAKATNSAIKPYNIEEEGNAQAWISFDSYRILVNAEGKWTDLQESLYQDIIAGKKKLNPEDVHDFFPVQKCQYWGQLKTDKLPIIGFHKYSMFPLIPTAIEGTNLEILHKKMMGLKPDGTIDMDTAVDYVTFKSGSKVSTITKDGNLDKLYSDNKTRTVDNSNFTKNTIFMEFLKKQLEVAPHFKNNVIFSTQLRKLIEDGLMEGGIPTDYPTADSKEDIDSRIASWNALGLSNDEQKIFNDLERSGKNNSEYETLYKKREAVRVKTSRRYALVIDYETNIRELTERKKQELLEEANWTIGPDGVPTGNLTDLLKFVSDELKRQDLSDHEIDFIKVDKNGKLLYDLSMSLSADKIERMLNAIVIKRLVRQKVTGEGLIQVAGTAYENIERFQNPTNKDLKKYRGTNDLPSYHRTYDKDGKVTNTAAMKVKIAMQGGFEKLLDDQDVIERSRDKGITKIKALNQLLQEDAWLDKGENRRMVTLVGVRIPVQGLNSMEFMEVYEFLPTEAGNIIVPPSEIVAKSGSDFDVDKLTIMMPSIGRYRGRPKLNLRMKVTESKQELMKTMESIVKTRKEYSDKFEEEFDKLFEAHYFKELTPQETAIVAQLKRERKDRSKEMSIELNDLMDRYKALGRSTPDTVIARILYLSAKISTSFQDYQDNVYQYTLTFSKEKQKEFKAPFLSEIKKMSEAIDDVQMKIASLSTKAIENDLIKNIGDILSLPENFAKLIRPNDTDLVKGLADDLAADVLKYDRFKPLNDGVRTFEKGGKVTKMISPTRVLEIPYNMYKHTSNNIGKQTLGLGAVDNTYNTLFNRIGAYMNPGVGMTPTEYLKTLDRIQYAASVGKKPDKDDLRDVAAYRRQTILMPHNTYNVNGDPAISLSHSLDAYGENNISDVISQLINGWVDIAKDAWIFNIQGNKEVAPVLLFMIQAGVPFKTAVYFASQPLVRQYVEEQKKAKSTFSGPLDKDPGHPNFYRNAARKVVLGDEKNGFGLGAALNSRNSKSAIYEKTLALTASPEKDGALIEFTQDGLEKNIKEYSKALNANKTPEIDDNQRAAFLHYLEIEDMAKAVRDIKMKMNVDTSKSSTLFEASDRILLIEQLKRDGRFPTQIVERILNDSPIGSFYIQEFQLAIWKDLFKLRNHDTFNKFILAKIRGGKMNDDIKKTGWDEEMFVNELRNGLTSYIFQNAVQGFQIDNLKFYKGIQVSDESSKLIAADKVKYLSIGAFVKGDILYIDKNKLASDYTSKAYLGQEYTKHGLAKVNINAFTTLGQYQKFVIERETLRYTEPFEKVKDTKEFRDYSTIFGDKLKRTFTKKQVEERAKQNKITDEEAKALLVSEYAQTTPGLLYNMWLRDKALDNINNGWKLFRSEDTYADQFIRLLSEFKKELGNNYAIMKFLGLSQTTGREKFTNLMAASTSLTAKEIELYHENLLDLANPTVKKVADPADNLRISQFFSRFTTVAFMQSGLNTKGVYSLIRIAPQDGFVRVMDGPVKTYTKHLNNTILDDYYEKFMRQNSKVDTSDEAFDEQAEPKLVNKPGRTRYQNYASDMTLNNAVKIDRKKENKKEGKKVIPDFAELKIVDDNTSTYSIEYGKEDKKNKSIKVGFTQEEAETLAKLYPSKIFVYNGAITQNNATGRDRAFSNPKIPNAYPLIVAESFAADLSAEFKDTPLQEGVMTISPKAKKAIDDSIKGLKELFGDGQNGYTTIVFNEAGYGQYMINRGPDAKIITPAQYQNLTERHKDYMKKVQNATPLNKWEQFQRAMFERWNNVKEDHPGQKTFIYLSKELFKNFGWVNPNSASSHVKAKEVVETIQKDQPISDAYVFEQVLKCFG